MRITVGIGLVWLAVIAGWLPAGAALFTHATASASWVLILLPVLATIGYGAFLHHSHRSVLIWLAALAGTFAQILSYIFVMVSPSGSDSSGDTGAAVGVVLFPVPVYLLLTALLWLGAGGMALIRWLRTRTSGTQ